LSPSPFSGIRLRLTVLYLIAGIAIVIVLSASAYGLLRYYFESTTDLALEHVLTHQAQLIHATVSPGLLEADQMWARSHHDVHVDRDHPGRLDGNMLDGDLALIYTLPLTTSGGVLTTPGVAVTPFSPDSAAIAAARENGIDARTTTINGLAVRLMTYRLDRAGNLGFLQVGRPIADQEAILQQMLSGLLMLGGVCTVLLTALSWWLAGRSLRPAKVAWERQQAFVANASHELRAPLTLIRATADVALRELPAGSSDQRELWDDVVRDCDHLARLVDDLLLLSRLDAGRLKLIAQPVPLAPLLTELERSIGRIADERGIRLEVQAGRIVALADRERVRQILLILLDNALRHTPSGGRICLAARQDGAMAELVVEDTGEGIAPEHLARIFERFYVVDSSRAASGSGLGLSIARALAELQGGSTTLESRVGQGTRVQVTLPAQNPGVRGLESEQAAIERPTRETSPSPLPVGEAGPQAGGGS
jgi:signal transduction histidine kinase